MDGQTDTQWQCIVVVYSKNTRDIALQSRLGIFNIILQFVTFANINKLTVGFVGLLVGQLLVFVHFMSVIP